MHDHSHFTPEDTFMLLLFVFFVLSTAGICK